MEGLQAELVGAVQQQGLDRQGLAGGGAGLGGRQAGMVLYLLGDKELGDLHPFDDDGGAYNQADAAGFIKLNALRLRLLGQRDRT